MRSYLLLDQLPLVKETSFRAYPELFIRSGKGPQSVTAKRNVERIVKHKELAHVARDNSVCSGWLTSLQPYDKGKLVGCSVSHHC